MPLSDIEQCVGNLDENDDQSVCSQKTDSTNFSFAVAARSKRFQSLIFCVLVFLGAGIAGAFLGLGLHDRRDQSRQHAEDSAGAFADSVRSAWLQYEAFSLWAHESCHLLSSSVQGSTDIDDILHMCSHEEFRSIYENVLSTGVHVTSLQYAPRVEDRYRGALEAKSREWMEEMHPEVPYEGITVTNWTDDGPVRKKASARPFYFPLCRVEPFEGNEQVFLSDTYFRSSVLIDSVLSEWKPSLSPPYRLVQDASASFSVFLTHPGVNTSVLTEQPHAVVAMVVRITDLLKTSYSDSHASQDVYLYDSTGDAMLFLGAVRSLEEGDDHTIVELEETGHQNVPVPRKSLKIETTIDVVDRRWTVVVVPHDSTASVPIFVVLGSILILLVFFAFATVLNKHLVRIDSIGRIKSNAEAEKANVYHQQVQRERRLNEYLAHEVRNPLTCAMAALSFVMDHTVDLVQDHQSRQMLLDDSRVVETSLNYINDLLRSMLDINRAKSGRLRVKNSPTDILHDVLEPAAAILCIKGTRVEVTIDCPKDLTVETDQLRLKQVCLNLVINASKFTESGFIRLRAEPKTDNVLLFVEDSGPSIPEHKQDGLFDSFQESLDPLNEGTGIGMSICYNLCQLLGAKIWLDTSYHSGIENQPGSRFVVELQKAPMDLESIIGNVSSKLSVDTDSTPLESDRSVASSSGLSVGNGTPGIKTPTDSSAKSLLDNVKVLFVDDETLLRKLFVKLLEKVAPTWTVTEASSGESVLQIVKEKKFDIIITDQYLPSPSAQMLGTEIVRTLRRQGTKSIICGISKNNVGQEFLACGADCFVRKPLPVKKDEFRAMLEGICGNNSFESPYVFSPEHARDPSETIVTDMPNLAFCNPVKGIEAGFRGVRTKIEAPRKRTEPCRPAISASRELFPSPVISSKPDGGSIGQSNLVDHFAIGADHPIQEPEQDFLKLVKNLKESLQTESQESRGSNDNNNELLSAISASEIDDCKNAFSLPKFREVLFVDDEKILRKLFIRSVRRVAPTWKIYEACDAMKALDLIRHNTFDIIFMDQYMPSPSLATPMLGTDAIKEMRQLGVDSLICGLSANQLRNDFIDAGADWFMLKPFPCNKELLYKELCQFCACRVGKALPPLTT